MGVGGERERGREEGTLFRRHLRGGEAREKRRARESESERENERENERRERKRERGRGREQHRGVREFHFIA